MNEECVERWSIESPWVFHDRKYIVSADVREDVLLVQVTDGLAADRWRGQFEPKHIEELTRKTGNFKKFSVFLNMLESAVTKSSEAVTLDLLSYMDLEAMWEKKLGSTKKQGISKPGSKRYLILTYNVEFDRIHYPLALSYFGCPNPITLQETIRKLQAKLDKTREHAITNDEVSILRRENAMLIKKKEKLEEDLLSYKHEVALHKGGGSCTKEINILKKVIKNMEEEALREHAKHKKYVNKKNEEVKNLLQEIEDLQLSERLLQSKVKSLTKELATLKQGCRPSGKSNVPTAIRSSERPKSDPGKRNFLSKASNFGSRTYSSARKTRRILSSENGVFVKTRTPSPSNTRVPRFDPTAYIERKKKIQLERSSRLRSRSNSIENLKCQSRGVSTNRSRPSSKTHRRNRSLSRNSSCNSSQASIPSNQSSLGSLSDEVVAEYRGTRKLKTTHHTEQQKMDISEIDARLNALQEFMKRSLESAKNYSGH